MDFPITTEGTQFASEFIAQTYATIKDSLRCFFANGEEDSLEVTRKMTALVNGDLPWITGDRKAKAIHLTESLLETVCEYLMDDPFTEQSLAAKLNISSNLAASFTNPAARYAPEFLATEVVVDRLRGLHGDLEYQVTKIPHKALRQSPMLTDLLDERIEGDWPTWKKVTFSNDQFPQCRPGSLSYAKFEVDAFCGGQVWGVPLDVNKARATALRLFDLKRYFEKQKDGLDEVRELSKRFRSVVLGT
jgi:hypothetical protein